MEDLTAVLERRSKAELVSLVRAMITRYPDLARMLDLSDLFDIYCWDRDQGGVGASDAVPPAILEHASPDERQRVAEWVEDILSEEDSQPGNWKRQVFGGLLLSIVTGEKDHGQKDETAQAEAPAGPATRDRSLARAGDPSACGRRLSRGDLNRAAGPASHGHIA